MQVRKKEDKCSGSIWDALPICEKEKDEINFENLSPDVRITVFQLLRGNFLGQD